MPYTDTLNALGHAIKLIRLEIKDTERTGKDKKVYVAGLEQAIGYINETAWTIQKED